jgi:hypothetical protein
MLRLWLRTGGYRCSDASATFFGQVSAAMISAILVSTAHAQGGPPFVTDDPDTPGNGNWEINAAAIGARSGRHWDFAAPDLDINYGWGEHVQLKVDLSWASAETTNGRRISGLGATDFGVKSRFIDQEKSGFALSIYPQLLMNLAPSSVARGLTSGNREFFLPVEISTVQGGFQIDAEFGRNFVQRGPDAWNGGLIAAHACGPTLECGLEVHGVLQEGQLQPLVNFGVHWHLSKQVILLAAAGREFAAAGEDRAGYLFYFGFQLLRES